MAHQPFPTEPQGITPDWLNRALGGTVTGVQAVVIGQDQGFSGCRLYRLLLQGADVASVVVKLSPADPAMALRMAAANGREVAFYAAHGRDPLLPVPGCDLALFDPATGASLLMLQDLGAHLSLPFADGLGPAEAGYAVQALATLHGQWWGAHGLPDTRLQNIWPFHTLWPDYLQHVATTMPDRPLPPALRALGDRIAADPDRACARLAAAGPPTRVHGDAQADNLRFADGRALFLDWQLTGRGAGIADVGYLMISSLTPALRRRHEGALLGVYQRALAAQGLRGGADVAGYVTAAAGKLWVTVAATLHYDNTTPAKRRWRQTDLERLAAFCADHDPAAALA